MTLSKIAIVIPSRNEEKYIQECLHSILKQTYPAQYIQVLVVDGMSTDQTAAKVEELTTRYSNIQLIINPQKTTPYALNLGIKQAKEADYIMILGAHASLNEDYIKKAVQFLNEHPDIDCIGGVLENIAETKTTEVISTAMSSVFGVGTAHFRTGAKEGLVDTVAFGMYRKQVFDKIGLFDE